MNPRLPKSALLPLAAGLIQMLSGCMASTMNDPNSDKSAGGSDEIDTRIAVDRTGKPMVAARIALVRPDDSTGKPVAVSATGEDGSFPSFVVPDGFYSMVLRDSGDRLGKYVDSVKVKNRKVPSGRDTLLTLGSIRGVVRVAAGHSPSLVSLGLVGTDILASVKADGTFRIELVPGGLYTLGAFTSMEGYGTLYKRIQLKDGQDLTLTDTFVMPFTGLPSPGALRVLQDTGNGNVRVSWSRVDHPDLLGYVLERVEGGTVTTSRYLIDTTWTDSLGASWEAMPLLGPWPARDVAYRVRSRSLTGSPDSKSAADTITAKPPEWTKRVEPIRVEVISERLATSKSLAWSSFSHPSFRQWVVERLVNGVVDCHVTTTTSIWSDEGCPELGVRKLDSSFESGTQHFLWERYGYTVDYRIAAQTRQGKTEQFWGVTDSKPDLSAYVTWMDSGLFSSGTATYRTGGWTLVRDTKNETRFTKDGVHWESAPTSLQGLPLVDFAGQGDSLWMVKLLPDSATFEIHSRSELGRWNVRTLKASRTFVGITQVFVREGKPLIIARSYQPHLEDWWWLAEADSLAPATFSTFEGRTPGYWRYGAFSADGANYECASNDQSNLMGLVRNGLDITGKLRFQSEGASVRILGGMDGVGVIASRAKGETGLPTYFRLNPQGRSEVIRLNAPVQAYSLAFQKAEISLYGTDGHLWKGKLNLPK